ncbi:hypothetical protein GCM10028821_15100 [Hymenobacter jeollabukensis]
MANQPLASPVFPGVSVIHPATCLHTMPTKKTTAAHSSTHKKEDPCWKGYEQAGTKKKDGKTVPNCVKKD